jgi:hypothetical protein
MKKNGLLLIGLLILLSCGKSESPQKVVIENKYSLEVPSFLVKATDLNEQASLQYQNVYKEFYVIVIDETKADVFNALTQNELTEKYTSDFKGYSNLILDNYYTNIEISQKSEVSDFTVNNLPAKKITIEGKYAGVEAFFCISLIEGKDRFYQIMTWTLKNKKDEFKDDMDKMIGTFSEI